MSKRVASKKGQRTDRERSDLALPASPGSDKGPGWHQVGSNLNDQAYWDGEAWTAQRRWTGATWVERPLAEVVDEHPDKRRGLRQRRRARPSSDNGKVEGALVSPAEAEVVEPIEDDTAVQTAVRADGADSFWRAVPEIVEDAQAPTLVGDADAIDADAVDTEAAATDAAATTDAVAGAAAPRRGWMHRMQVPTWATRKRDRPAVEPVEAASAEPATPQVAHRRWTYRALIGAGLAIILAVGGFQLYATLWTRHSQEVGQSLVHQFLKNQPLDSPVSGTSGPGGTTALASCTESQQSKDPVKGLLEIPKLKVVAPVEQGLDDAQLDVAVGHNPDSVWPGAVGNSVLAAHNVSYFVGLSQLIVGDSVLFVAPCTTTVFQVTAHTIVNAGAPVYNTPTPTITMVTCWPTNALWFTPQRYLVTARQVRQVATGGGGQQYLATSKPPSVPVPADLASQGVTLATYSLPMGSFNLAGSPDSAWAQTTNPLLVEDSGVEAYIAGVRALVQNRLDWWNAFAPGVAAPTALVGAKNPSYLSSLNVTVTAAGTQASAVTLTNTISISGGKAPGRYAVAVDEVVKNGVLTIKSWTLTPL